MAAENEEEYRDEVQERVETILSRIHRLREPFQKRRHSIMNALLSHLERRTFESQRGYYNPEQESEVEKLKAEVEKLKKEKEQMEQELHWRRQSRGKAWLE